MGKITVNNRTIMPYYYHILFLVLITLYTTKIRAQDTEETSIRYRMTEENQPQMVLGNIAIDARLDVQYGSDVLDDFRFSFLTQSSRYMDYFTIGEQSGLLSAAVSIDRDELCPHQATCDIPLDISVQPGQYFQIIKVTVSIEDLNDNSPTFPENPIDRFLSEASGPNSARIPLAAAVDPDGPEYNIKSYEQITGLDTFELQVTTNPDNTVNMELVLKQELDREKVQAYTVQVIATDGEKTGTATINVEIRDVNDNNPKFDNQTYETFLYENTPKYTTILKVHAKDPDAGDNGEIVYGFTTKTQRAFGDIFNIDETTGEIFVVDIVDYEDVKTFTLDVTAKDKSDDPLPSIAKVTIHVKDLNDHAPQITVNSDELDGHVEIPEDAQIGDFVAHITVVDPDGVDNGDFSCSLDDDSQFELLQLYKTEFKIVSKALFDREQQALYDIALVCTDKGATPQASTKRVQVQVTDVNDHAPVFMPDFYNAIITENNKIGAHIITVNATDKDTRLNGQIRYELEGMANGLFDINPETGNITTKVILDHELQKSFTITVIARDQGNPQKTSTATLLLNIQDIDDEAPKFSKSTYVFKVEENQPPNTEVDQISATDPDSEPYNFFTFSLDQRYNTENAFRIDENTGMIYTSRMLDRELQGVYHLVVVATSTKAGQQNSTNVFVSVLDQNDNEPVIDFPNPFNNTVYVKEHDPIGSVIGYIVAKDADAEKNQQLTFNFTNGNDEKYFSINKFTGAVIVRKTLRDQQDRQFSLVVKVHDNGATVRTAEAILNIVVNESQAAAGEGNITSNQNLTIVIIIATVSGFLMVVLIIAIVMIILVQKNNEKRKRNKYNYMPRVVDQRNTEVVLANGKPSNLAGGDSKLSGTPKKEVSFKTDKSGLDRLNGSFDISLEKGDPMLDYTKPEAGSSFTEADYQKQRYPNAWTDAPSVPSAYKVITQPEHTVQKPWPVAAGQLQKPNVNGPVTDKDSDSACSGEMSNTDSGRGSNDDHSDNHFRSTSPHWDPNSGLSHKGAPSPHHTPSKDKQRPPRRSSSINTKALNSGVHHPHPAHHRDIEIPYGSHPHLPPRRVPSHSQQHQDPALVRDRLDSASTWNSNPASSSHELSYHGNNAFHPNRQQSVPSGPNMHRPNWKISGDGGGYYASHV